MAWLEPNFNLNIFICRNYWGICKDAYLWGEETMNNGRVLRLALGITAAGSALLLLVFWPQFNYALGFAAGSLVSLLGFEILKWFGMHGSMAFLRGGLLLNRVIRMSLYAGVMILAMLFPETLHIIPLFFGFFVLKLSLVLTYRRKKGMGSREH